MCLAQQLGVDIFYQDTDSMVMQYSGVEKLRDAFKLKYGRELIASNKLGCFSSDFEAEIKCNIALWSQFSIYLAKKCYNHDLVVVDIEKEFLEMKSKYGKDKIGFE